jgi:hypothetical protein
MKLVEVLTIDDATIPKVVFKEMGLSRYSSQGYYFDWAPATNKVPINADNYIKYVNYFNGFESSDLGMFSEVRYKIIIFDLGYNSTNVNLDEQKRSEIERWVKRCPLPNEDTQIDHAMDGIYLCALALRNQCWEGVVIICSGMGLTESVKHCLNQIKDQFVYDNRVSLLFKGSTLSRNVMRDTAGHIESNMGILGESIESFFRQQGNLETIISSLIWNANTRNWFAEGNIECPHNLPIDISDIANSKNELIDSLTEEHTLSSNINTLRGNRIKRKDVITTIKIYLQNLFNCELPQEWFLDGHVEQLYDNLKRLVGEYAIIHSGEGYSMTLGGIIIILASVHRNTPSTQNWLTGISWQDCEYTSVRVGKEDKKTYHLLFNYLVDLFQILETNKYTGLPLIQSVNLNTEKIEIILNHNFSLPDKEGRKSLIDVFKFNLNCDCGDLCKALRKVKGLLQDDRVDFYLNESLLTVLYISAN